MSAAYVDASALVKLVVPEAESVALAAELSTWDEWISAAITITEVTRAAARWAAASKLSSSDSETLMSQVKAVTSRLTLMDVDLALLQQAAAIPPVELRSLDAIHLATVASLAADIGAFVTYDRELGSAGEAAGLLKISPA